MLAAMTTDEVLAIYPAERLVAATELTIATRSQLLAELERVRDVGFATNFEESEAGLGAVGLALLDQDERPAAAFTVAGPLQRMTQGCAAAIARDIRPVVAAATAELRGVRYC